MSDSNGFVMIHAVIFICSNFLLCPSLLFLFYQRRQAHLCVLATNCDEPMYQKLVEALCKEHSIDIIKVDDNKKLGEWAGLCKIDKEGKARKIVGCSCVVVKDYGKETPAHDVLSDYLRTKKVAE